jgi:galactokinase
MRLDCHTLSIEYAELDPASVEIVIIDSMKRRGLVDSAYNERRQSCENGLTMLCELAGKQFPSLRHVPQAVFDTHAPRLGETVRRRVRHNLAENERVLRFAECARKRDWDRAGELLYESHASLRDDFEVSCPELDRIVEIARGCDGVFGCRMTGGGFGGCAVALVKPAAVAGFSRAMRTEYLKSHRLDPVIYPTAAQAGAGVERVA